MKKMLLGIVASAIGLPAMADTGSGIYGSVGAGAYRLESGSFDDTALSMKLLGGYSFNQYVALETSYTRLFETSDRSGSTRVKIDGNLWDIGARLSYPVTRTVSPYGRLGWSYLDSSAAVIDDGDRFRLNDYDDAFSWALGAAFNLGDRLTLFTEYANVDVDDADLDSLSLNLSYGFGSW